MKAPHSYRLDAAGRRLRRDAIARFVMLEVTDPPAARNIGMQLTRSHKPIPRAGVVALFGEEAAEAWDAAKEALATLQEKLK